MWQRASKSWGNVLVRALIGGVIGLSIPSGVAWGQFAHPGVFPPDSHPFAKTYPQWTARWWQWALAIPSGVNPILESTGTDCDIGQSGPVWFLAGTAGGAVTRTCTIPASKAILFPIVNTVNDYPCPNPSFQPAPGQTLEDFLTDGAKNAIDPVDILDVEVDGRSLRHLTRFRSTSKLFQFTGAADLENRLDPCVTGSPQLGVSDGYWLMLRPLPVGEHTLHFKGGTTGGFVTEVTYTLTIEPSKGEDSHD